MSNPVYRDQIGFKMVVPAPLQFFCNTSAAYFSLLLLRQRRMQETVKIVRTALFEKCLKKLGAAAADLARLEAELAARPTMGDVIQGLGGARKARFSMAGRGKRGGGQAIYVLVVQADTVYLLLAYAKNDQADLSENQRKTLAKIVKELTDG